MCTQRRSYNHYSTLSETDLFFSILFPVDNMTRIQYKYLPRIQFGHVCCKWKKTNGYLSETKHGNGLSFFKCQISSIVFQISIILDLPFSFNSLVATLPKDTTENFNLLSVVRLTRLCERVERFTVVARVIYLDKAYNALYTLQVDSTLFSSLNHSGCLPSLCERGTFWSCVLNAVSIYTKLS